jgi:hypothetical protein
MAGAHVGSDANRGENEQLANGYDIQPKDAQSRVQPR